MILAVTQTANILILSNIFNLVVAPLSVLVAKNMSINMSKQIVTKGKNEKSVTVGRIKLNVAAEQNF